WSMEPSDKGPFTFGRLGVYAYDTPLSVRWKLSETPLGRLERLKCRITNSLSRAGRLAFWTARPQRRK
ncbi:MAG: hypothetical protein ACE5GA_09870, partial [Candidatus Zixiibacteriota bacterium]